MVKLLAVFFLAIAPAPVGAGTAESWICHHLGHPLAGQGQIRCLALGPEAELRPDVAAGLAPDVTVDSLTPRSVQAFYAGLVAERLGARLVTEQESGNRFRVGALFPA